MEAMNGKARPFETVGSQAGIGEHFPNDGVDRQETSMSLLVANAPHDNDDRAGNDRHDSDDRDGGDDGPGSDDHDGDRHDSDDHAFGDHNDSDDRFGCDDHGSDDSGSGNQASVFIGTWGSLIITRFLSNKTDDWLTNRFSEFQTREYVRTSVYGFENPKLIYHTIFEIQNPTIHGFYVWQYIFTNPWNMLRYMF